MTGELADIVTLDDAQRVFPITAQGVCGGHTHPGGSCAVPLVWCVTEHGKRQPVDPIPDPDHGLLILTVDGTVVRSRVETLFDRARDDGGPPRFMPHHATCVDVRLWRNLQARRPGGEL